MKYILLIACLLLSACNGTNGMSVYSLSNSDIEAVLKQQLPKLSDKASLMGLPVQFDVDNIDVEVGPENREVIVLGADTKAVISALGFEYPVGLDLKIEGAPHYDSEKKAVFLRDVKLLDSTVDAAGYKGNLSMLDGQAMGIINKFLDQYPVYTLDTSDPKIALLSKLPLDIKVVEGAIQLIPSM